MRRKAKVPPSSPGQGRLKRKNELERAGNQIKEHMSDVCLSLETSARNAPSLTDRCEPLAPWAVCC